jgi:hypothetical protein
MHYLTIVSLFHFNFRRAKHILNHGASGLKACSHKSLNGSAHTKKDPLLNQIQANIPELDLVILPLELLLPLQLHLLKTPAPKRSLLQVQAGAAAVSRFPSQQVLQQASTNCGIQIQL